MEKTDFGAAVARIVLDKLQRVDYPEEKSKD